MAAQMEMTMSMTIPGSVGTTAPTNNGSSTTNPSDAAIMTVTSSFPPDVTRKTLEGTVERALSFLRGVAGEKRIREVLHKHGYSDAHQQEGWRRLSVAAGFHQPLGAQDDNDVAVRNAITEIDAIDEQVFRVTSASVSRRLPIQGDFLLGGIAPGRGAASVLNLEILLDRIDQLETGAGREATSVPDRATVQLLSQRGLSIAERERLRQLINVAKRSNPVDTNPTASEERDKQYVANLQALREWYEEWSEIARPLFTRRDYLIRLGMASTRRSSAVEEEAEAPVAAPVSPADPGV